MAWDGIPANLGQRRVPRRFGGHGKNIAEFEKSALVVLARLGINL